MLEVYQRADDLWAWRLRATNGQIIATDGGQGYVDRGECARMAEQVIDGHHMGLNPTFIPRAEP
ncbi:hypothetical protein L332_03525 [Agrococcus pavilionensis RW1]|uniref:DUF1508 domain-containing protein n=1 Tax=Agrococcus pavilionensis RW1 TaxID=1330458 RepID=U1LMF7_9MICO|nr:YegP family protein [Agrococcus pavilionensis]ERG63524.1 hypothetical protein L332_03525 [Agrococcus pavilionensis RW1]